MEAVGSIEGGVAVAVFGVASTVEGGFLVAWRANELPYLRVSDAALGWRRRILRRRAARRRRTIIVVNPESDVASRSVVANIVRSSDGDAGLLIDGDARAIDAGAIACVSKSIRPGSEIGVIGVSEAATLFDV